jgi:hypothetical protein
MILTNALGVLIFYFTECLGDEETWSRARTKNKALRTQMESKMNASNIFTYELSWNEKGKI